MIFHGIPLAGARLIEMEPHVDDRGFFARVWCRDEFRAEGLRADFVQSSLSRTERRGTLRGLHYQAPPKAEVKLVRCLRGAVHDVIVDLRPASPSYLEHFAVELDAENRLALYVPEGFAHGFQTLEDGSEVLYHMTEFHSPEHARGVRWNDPAFGIDWPVPDPLVSERDRTLADYRAVEADAHGRGGRGDRGNRGGPSAQGPRSGTKGAPGDAAVDGGHP